MQRPPAPPGDGAQPPTSFERHRRLYLPPFYGFKASDEQLLQDFLKPFVPGEEGITCPIHTIEDVYSSTPQDLTSRYGQGTDTEWFFFSNKRYPDATLNAHRDIDGGVWIKQGHTKKIFVDEMHLGFKRTQAFRARSSDHAQWMMEEFSLCAESNYILAKIFRDPDQKKQNPESGSIPSTSKQTQSRHHPFQPNNTPHNFGTHPFQPRYQTHNQAQQTETPSHLTQHTQTLPDHTHNQAQQTEPPFSSYTAYPSSSLPNRYSSPHPNYSIPNRFPSANRNSSYQTQNHESVPHHLTQQILPYQTHNQAQQTATPVHFTQHTQTLPDQPHNQAQQTETPPQSPTADETFIYRSDQETREWRMDHFLDDSNQQ